MSNLTIPFAPLWHHKEQEYHQQITSGTFIPYSLPLSKKIVMKLPPFALLKIMESAYINKMRRYRDKGSPCFQASRTLKEYSISQYKEPSHRNTPFNPTYPLLTRSNFFPKLLIRSQPKPFLFPPLLHPPKRKKK